MTNQYQDKYKDQYQQETSQIHAPADLIQRTRQAVAQEEQRVQAESMTGASELESETEMQSYVEGSRRMPHWKIYQWALPVAAAAVLVLVMNMSAMLRRDTGGDSGMAVPDAALETEAGGSGESDGAWSGFAQADVEAAPTEEEDFSEATDIVVGAEETDDSVSATAGSMEEADSMRDTAERNVVSASPAEAEDNRVEESRDDSVSEGPRAYAENDMEMKSSKEESTALQMEITEVKSAPAFCSNPDTDRVLRDGIVFYIAADDNADLAEEYNGWKAYVDYSGRKYMITGQAADRDVFLEKAQKLLAETVTNS